ncbi:TPA: hypothetical protein QC364_000727 [Bacillus cereus]|uniref:hypothetical protein n=1 Tax=Bacillus paranthracis TaxID=2026186 RepID=UPI002D79549E|nr:hypothetical protein [Bacillus paranthracis]HDR8453936.1 hypothetical protein [Bacillus cereus]
MISTGSIFLKFDYVNWQGVAGYREIRVIRIFFGSTDYHKESQWLMEAWDLKKQEKRVFAMKDMSNVKDMRYD